MSDRRSRRIQSVIRNLQSKIKKPAFLRNGGRPASNCQSFRPRLVNDDYDACQTQIGELNHGRAK